MPNPGFFPITKRGLLSCFLAVLLIACTACVSSIPEENASTRQRGSTGSTRAPDDAEPAHNNAGTPETEAALSAAEALSLISKRFQYEGNGEVSRLESEWAGDVEFYHVELHWYGDAITYYSIFVDSHTGAMEIEEIEYEYAQDMLEYWRRSAWYWEYLEIIMDAQDFAREAVYPPGYDGRYPFYLTGFRLVDLDFDGVPELLIFGDGAGASDGLRIFALGLDGVSMIFRGSGNLPEINLYRRLSDDRLAWAFVGANGDSFLYEGAIYMTNASTVLDGRFATNAELHTISVINIDVPDDDVYEYIIDGRVVSQSEFERLMDDLLLYQGGYQRLNPFVIALEYHSGMYRDFQLTNTYSEDDIWRFLESYEFVILPGR